MALLALVGACHGSLARILDRPALVQVVAGLMIGLVAMTELLQPIRFADGIFFDL